MHIQCFSKHKFDSRSAHIVYQDHKFCTKCALALINIYNALPNDGSVRGALLAIKLGNSPTEVRRALINYYKKEVA